MAYDDDTMISPNIETLLDKVDSKFTLVTLASRRARQINSYFHQLSDGSGSNVPPQVTTSARKPLSIAFEEIGTDKISYEPLSAEELAGMAVVPNVDPVVAVVAPAPEATRAVADGEDAS
jgi:DNA-directed RNA polymerase subunit omega